MSVEKAKEAEKNLSQLSAILDEVLEKIYGERMGFFLSVFRFQVPGVADYISNGKREGAIEALKETVKRLENKEDIPTPIGEA